ncbi:MAG: MarR family transcriptional regulator [Deltaproteobacteria bacterium]|nr:MarR family transcriptional regulator [Deltaproteobacteria bacterium]
MESERKKLIGGVFDNLRRVIQVVHGYSNRAQRVGGLTGPQLWAIRVLSESAPVRVSDLARQMYLHPSTVVGILDRLEAKGLVVRIRSKRDHRVVEVSLTGKGKTVAARSPAVAQGLLLKGLEKLPGNDLRVVSGGLEALVGILGARTMPPRLLFSREVNLPGGGVPVGRDRKH